MNRFRKKPVVIEAVRVSKRMDLTAPEWWAEAVRSNAVIVHGMGKFTRDQPWVEVSTLEGVMRANEGDWIIRGVQGELYPCKPTIFEATYEPADSPPPAADAVSVDALMEMAQEYASAWSLVGGPLDRGNMLDDAADAKERLRRAIAAALAARGKP